MHFEKEREKEILF